MSFVRKIIHGATKSVAPYSPAVQVNGTLYISGQLGNDPATNAMVPGGIEAECKQALTNMGTILKNAGGSYKNVVKVTVLLSDMAHFAKMNEVYRQFFTEPLPARAAYAVKGLPLGANVEIEAIAVIGNITEA